MIGARGPSPLERVISLANLVMFWSAFGLLAAGLAVWLAHPQGYLAARSLGAGLFALMAMPVLRLVASLAAAARSGDRVLLVATLAVAGILLALTLRGAASLK
jgi:uncharacterized membrane protein